MKMSIYLETQSVSCFGRNPSDKSLIVFVVLEIIYTDLHIIIIIVLLVKINVFLDCISARNHGCLRSCSYCKKILVSFCENFVLKDLFCGHRFYFAIVIQEDDEDDDR